MTNNLLSIEQLQEAGWRTRHELANDLNYTYKHLAGKFKKFTFEIGYSASWLKDQEVIRTIKNPDGTQKVFRFLPPEIVREFKAHLKRK